MYGYDQYPNQRIYEENEPGTRQWIDYNSFVSETSENGSGSITSLSFHDSCDLLWIGNENGRVTSYLHSFESTILKYSSFMGHSGSVLQLLPIPKHIVSISSEMTRIHTLGGLPITTLKPDLTDFNGEVRELTCGTLFEPSGGLFRAETQNYLFLGASSNLAYAYDLNIPETPLSVFDVESSSVCVHSSVTFLSVGGLDGKIRLLDPSLRSNSVQHALEAHTGGVSSISVQNDGMTLISCGYQGRAINPYDPNSPMMYHLDPIVKIFDMRMLRQVAPLTLAIPPPSYVKFLPKSSESSPVNVLAVSSNGYIQTLSLNSAFEPLMETLQIQYATLGNPPTDSLSNPTDEVTVVGTSSNGHFIGVGSHSGVVSLHASVNPQDSAPIFQFNKDSEVLTIPPSLPVPPPRPIALDSQEVATAYTVANHLLTGEENRQLGSSFLSTPKLLKSHFKSYSRLKILPELLSETTFQGSVGSTKNKTGFPPNSFLSHQARSHLYAKSDPRKVHQPAQTSSADHSRDVSNRTDSVGSASSNEGPESVLKSKSNKNWFEGESPHAVYAQFKSPRGKSRIQKFNYSAFNNTPFVGMENFSPHSWTNPLLQFLFALPNIRQSALASQLSPFHHSMPISLLGELGFLFDMMISIRDSSIKHPSVVSKVVTPSNFQRALQVTPEAVVVGLFSPIQEEGKLSSNFLGSPPISALSPPHIGGVADDLLTIPRVLSDGIVPHSPQNPARQEPNLNEAKKLQHRIQLFTKFLFQQLKKEYDSEVKFYQTNRDPYSQPVLHDAMAATFAFETVTTTTFLTSQTKGLTTHHTSYSIELVYSIPISPPRSYVSFSEIFYATVCKTSQMRGWCAQSDSYEPCRQIKRIQFSKLQKILTLLCGDTFLNISEGQKLSAEEKSEHKLWGSQNPLGGPWLPASLEVLFIPNSDNVDSETGQILISELLSEDGHKELRAENSPSTTHRWLIYDGKTTTFTTNPASVVILPNHPDSVIKASLKTSFCLFGVISGIRHKKHPNTQNPQSVSHPVLHMMTSKNQDGSEWTLFNDFSIIPCREIDARVFPDWRFPCVVFFLKEDDLKIWEQDSLARSFEQTPRNNVPPTILSLPSLSTVPCVPIQTTHSDLTYLAFDAEFVSVEVEKAEMDARGQRIVHDEGRQVIARISLLEGSKVQNAFGADQNQLKLLVDDYVLPVEPIVDYVSRFSGLHEEDLNPVLSRHAVVTSRTAYLKIKYYVDRGYIFVGHGLQKDFDIANIFVPPEQIRDTVELWRLPNQRKISLRFLASHVLGMEIQDDLHDSIEDSRTAYLLYKKYEEEKKKGDPHLHEILTELYAFGARTNWTIGLDRISSSPIHQMKKTYSTAHKQAFPPHGQAHPQNFALVSRMAPQPGPQINFPHGHPYQYLPPNLPPAPLNPAIPSPPFQQPSYPFPHFPPAPQNMYPR